MTRGRVSPSNAARAAGEASARFPAIIRGRVALVILALIAAVLILSAVTLPALADGDGTITFGSQPAPSGENFGQYLADHESDLAPFFEKNADELGRLGIPVMLEMMGWVVVVTMAVGWGVDVLLSRGFAFFFAPAFAEIKRSIFYATGRLFLSFVYTGLTLLAIVFSLKLAHAGIVMLSVVSLLLVVAFAAQLVWILYLYRTSFVVSVGFYLVVVITHAVVGVLIAQPLVGAQASGMATAFIDQVITKKMQDETVLTRQELVAAQSSRDEIKAKIADLQNDLAQGQAEADQLRNDIEARKNSDIYVLSRIIQARTRGELASAREQLAGFPAKFPASSLLNLARMQLAQVNDQMALEDAQKRQSEADAAKAAADAQAELLARVAKGEVTLSEMRHALIGKTRAEVSSLLGTPSDTASDSWDYQKQMIFNPLTNAKYGLVVYFLEGVVQGVDYDRSGVSQ